MRPITRALPLALACLLGACAVDNSTNCCTLGTPNLRIINAFTTPVDVLVDGNVAISSLNAGSIGTAAATSGSHMVTLRATGSAAFAAQAVTTSEGSLSTLAAVRVSSGAFSLAVLDDTNSVVPAGATKLRVLHLAPSAGELQVFRTQPDYQQPVSWQFPFTYQAQPSSLSAPFYQSTPGTWEVRIWATPAGASGWANAPVKVLVPLASGEKKTVLILDNPAGGVRVEVL